MVVANQPIATKRLEAIMKDAQRDVLHGMRTAFQHKWLMFKSSLIGTFVGILPGLGAGPAHWIAYAYARQTEGSPRNIRQGGYPRCHSGCREQRCRRRGADPNIDVRIPGSGPMAILLAMLILYGFQPGPAMLSTHLDLTISLVYTVALANIITIPIMLRFSSWIVRSRRFLPSAGTPLDRRRYAGRLQGSSSMGDLALTAAFGVLGVFMKRYGWPRPPILIAVVLGKILEKFLWLSVSTWGWSMMVRPQFLIIMILMLLFVASALWLQRGTSASPLKSLVSDSAAALENGSGAQGASSGKPVDRNERKALTIEIVGEVLLLTIVGGFFVYMFLQSLDWSAGAVLMPYIALLIGLPFLVLRTIHVARVWFGTRNETMTVQQIMDTGFRIGENPEAERRLFVRILAAIAILYVGLWIVGFHIMLPLWTFMYLYRYGKVRIIWSALFAFLTSA